MNSTPIPRNKSATSHPEGETIKGKSPRSGLRHHHKHRDQGCRTSCVMRPEKEDVLQDGNRTTKKKQRRSALVKGRQKKVTGWKTVRRGKRSSFNSAGRSIYRRYVKSKNQYLRGSRDSHTRHRREVEARKKKSQVGGLKKRKPHKSEKWVA